VDLAVDGCVQTDYNTTMCGRDYMKFLPLSIVDANIGLLPELCNQQDSTKCGNGFECSGSEVCAQASPRSGAKFGCLPHADMVLCSDERYSCPAGYTCDTEKGMCKSQGGDRAKLLTNSDSRPPASGEKAGGSFCSIVKPYLPVFCECEEGVSKKGGILYCEAHIQGREDATKVTIGLEPCREAARMTIQVFDSSSGVDYEYQLEADHTQQIKFPQLTFDITPQIQVGVVFDVAIAGTVDNLRIGFGLDGCAKMPSGKVCGGDLMPFLPYTLVDHQFHFLSYCEAEPQSAPAIEIGI